ncbi:hypothetical protein OPQ81_006673 [Rhizoctonia solani]|nr:hypothetical protein OPQ81_006673 [Rhizoctonia solani]
MLTADWSAASLLFQIEVTPSRVTPTPPPITSLIPSFLNVSLTKPSERARGTSGILKQSTAPSRGNSSA